MDKSPIQTTISFLSLFPKEQLCQILLDVASGKIPLAEAIHNAAVATPHLKTGLQISSDCSFSDVFGNALDTGDLPMIQGCIDFNFVDIHALFPVRNPDSKNKGQTALVKLFEGFHQDRMSSQTCKEAFQCLLDNGANVEAPSASNLTPSSLYYESSSMRPAIDHLTEMMKWCDNRKKMQTLCDMASLLCRSGAIVDLYQGRFRLKGEKSSLSAVNKDAMKRPDNAVEIPFLPHCCPSFFDEVRKRRTQATLNFNHRNKLWRLAGADLPRGHHRTVTNMEWIITRLHQDLFDQSNTREYDGPREIGNMFERKILKLFHDHGLWSRLEPIHAVQEIVTDLIKDERHTTINGPDLEQYAAASWYKLCMAVSFLVNESSQAQERELGRQKGELRHQLVISSRWDPRIEWIRRVADAHSPALDSDVKQEAWQEFLEGWEKLVLEQGQGRRWFEVEEDKWFVPVQHAKAAFKAFNNKSASLLGM